MMYAMWLIEFVPWLLFKMWHVTYIVVLLMGPIILHRHLQKKGLV